MAIKFYKVINNLPQTLQPDSVYFVRSGEGVNIFITDMTGNIGYTLNGVSSDSKNIDGGSASSIYTTEQRIDGGGA